jgi:hypothetical protein
MPEDRDPAEGTTHMPMEASVRTWQEAGPELEAIRRREVREADNLQVLELLEEGVQSSARSPAVSPVFRDGANAEVFCKASPMNGLLEAAPQLQTFCDTLKKFKQVFVAETGAIAIPERVSLMTPENIHLTSFMFEPIVDMSDQHLRRLCTDVVGLKRNCAMKSNAQSSSKPSTIEPESY